MRKVIAGFACSLDGYIEGPHGEYDWILVNKEIDFAEQMKQYDTFLYGRRTYEAVAKEGSRYPKSAAHYVFSHSLDRVADGFILVKGDLRNIKIAVDGDKLRCLLGFSPGQLNGV